MDQKDFKILGDDVKKAIQDAIDSQNFDQLGKMIKDGTDKMISSMSDGYQNVGKNVVRNMTKTAQEATQKSLSWMQDQTQKKNELVLYKKKLGTTTARILQVCGGFFGFVFAIPTIFCIFDLIGSIGTPMELLSTDISVTIFFAICFGINAFLFQKNKNVIAMAKRFQRYVSYLNEKTYIEIKNLASSTGKSLPYIQKDLETMIEKGWFLQGHLSEDKTYLMTSHETHRKYLELKKQEEAKKVEEANNMQAQSDLNPEIQEVLRMGQEYIDAIHKSNDAIPGEEISRKIASMEELVIKIFDRVEHNPESVGGIRKLMDYYLPMTVKLLDAYEELDRQTIQGDNILASKKEIEESLDTLNAGFEKLLDDMFQEQAWDVSSDISVLKTMLAQDGLVK